MKKILFVAMAACAFSFSACTGNKTDNAANAADSAQVEETSAANVAAQSVFQQLKDAASDPAKLQAAVGAAQVKIQELLASGNAESVKQYTQILQDLINGDKSVQEALTAVKDAAGSGNLLSAFNSVIGAATAEGATAESFVEATKKAGTDAYTETAMKDADAVDAVKDAVENAPEAAKQAVENAAQDVQNQAKEAVNQKVDEAKTKANDAINNAQQKANDAVNNAAQKGADAARKALGL
ncbi:MAG: hypothetical protein IJ659_04165 [Alloprevotella sp.]|nr:hypothetical protein [Alloprevotella sp.]